MRLLLTLSALLAIPTLAQTLPTAPEPLLPDDIDWPAAAAAGPLRGASSTFLVGSSDDEGIYVQRVKLAPGALISPHIHSEQRYSVVLEGTIYVGFGNTVDEAAVVAIPAGGQYLAPAGVPHYILAREAMAVYQETGIGPSATTFVSP